MNDVFETERLLSIPIPIDVHAAIISGEFPIANRIMEVSGLQQLTLPLSVWQLRLKQLKIDPASAPWLMRALVLKDSREVIGNIGFHGSPACQTKLDGGFCGMEFGYTVIEEYRRLGFAKEAAAGLVTWAGRVADISKFILSIAPNNRASIGVATTLGFEKHSDYEHKERGMESLYILDTDCT